MRFDPLEGLAILFLNSIEAAVNKNRKRSAEFQTSAPGTGEGPSPVMPDDLTISEISDLPPAAR